jgi:hypothetical protein
VEDVLGPVRGESHADEPLGPGTVGQFYAAQAEPWTLTLDAPTDQATRLDVAGTFEFMEAVIPDRGTTAEAQSVRLLQVSTLFIDRGQHDVDALRFRNADGLVTAYSAPDLASSLLPVTPSVMDPEMPMFDSLPTDALGQPHGNTPS